MKITPIVSQANGAISVTIQASFVGDASDATDRAKIAAFGDPQISLVGSNGVFTGVDPNGGATFTFQFPTTSFPVGITTTMSSQSVRFMSSLPAPAPGSSVAVQGALDCITTDPSGAAQFWYNAMIGEIQNAMTALRNQQLVPTLNAQTV